VSILDSLDTHAAKQLYDANEFDTYKNACSALFELVEKGEQLTLEQLRFLTSYKMTKIDNEWFRLFGVNAVPQSCAY